MKSCELPEDELEGRMLLAGMAQGSDVFLSPLLDIVTKAPRVFNDGVLSKLDTVDLMMLSRVNKNMRRITKVHKYTTVTDTKEDIFRVPTFVRSVALLRWARDNGCPWDERTCAAVAAGGNLEVLKWARENGCPAPRPKLGDLTRTASTAKGSCEDVVYTHFMGPQGEHENGLNVYDVISALKGRFTSGQVWQAIESLVSDGHLYSTVDSRHFRATLL